MGALLCDLCCSKISLSLSFSFHPIESFLRASFGNLLLLNSPPLKSLFGPEYYQQDRTEEHLPKWNTTKKIKGAESAVRSTHRERHGRIGVLLDGIEVVRWKTKLKAFLERLENLEDVTVGTLRKRKKPSTNNKRLRSGNASSSPSAEGKSSGAWTQEEHQALLQGLKEYGREWKKITLRIPTRTYKQVHDHARRYFAKRRRDRESSAPNACAASVHGDRSTPSRRSSDGAGTGLAKGSGENNSCSSFSPDGMGRSSERWARDEHPAWPERLPDLPAFATRTPAPAVTAGTRSSSSSSSSFARGTVSAQERATGSFPAGFLRPTDRPHENLPALRFGTPPRDRSPRHR